MALIAPEKYSTVSLLLRAGLLVISVFGFSQPRLLEAAPIVFEATTLTSGGCGATLSGNNFYFDGTITYNACSGRQVSVGILWPLPEQATYNSPVVTGSIDVPGAPGRLPVAYGGGQPTLYKTVDPPIVPDTFTGVASVNVVLSGTVQVCLEPANVQTPGEIGPCDPEFANFGIININVAGLASFRYYNGYSGTRDFLGFTGTSAAAPEPSHLGGTVGLALLLLAIISHNKAWKRQAISLADSSTAQ